MNIEELRSYVLKLPATTEGFPFDNDTLVFKVSGKMFLLVSLERQPLSFNFKALPADGLKYREQYPAVSAGYHMDKKHWNTVILDGSVSRDEILRFIKNSYDLVLTKLPKYKQKEIKDQAWKILYATFYRA